MSSENYVRESRSLTFHSCFVDNSLFQECNVCSKFDQKKSISIFSFFKTSQTSSSNVQKLILFVPFLFFKQLN